MIFIIEPSFVDKIKNIVDFAEANPLCIDDILDMKNGDIPIAGDTEGYYLIDRFGTKIVYTIDVMPECTLRHLSISIDNGKRMPHPAIVQEIITLFGFNSKLEDCIIEIETRENNTVGILNVAEKI